MATFLMVEGGRIDHASHANDARRTVTELLEFDEAVKVALDATGEANDTLIVATADHETGGLAINGYAPIAVSGDAMFTEKPLASAVTDVITYSNGPGADRTKFGAMDHLDLSYRQPSIFAGGSATHTGVDVHAWASGPGAEEFRGTIDNTEIAIKIMETLGLK